LIGNPKHGSVAVGSFGDLVVLDGNPFEKPSVLWNMSEGRTVIKSGRVVK